MRTVRDQKGSDERERSLTSGAAVLLPLLLTIRDAARVLAVGRTTMYELIAAGAVEVVHIGRSARVPVAALEAFVASATARYRDGLFSLPLQPSGRRTAPGRRVPQRGDQGRLFGGPRQEA